jgi:hypothetical protein
MSSTTANLLIIALLINIAVVVITFILDYKKQNRILNKEREEDKEKYDGKSEEFLFTINGDEIAYTVRTEKLNNKNWVVVLYKGPDIIWKKTNIKSGAEAWHYGSITMYIDVGKTIEKNKNKKKGN